MRFRVVLFLLASVHIYAQTDSGEEIFNSLINSVKAAENIDEAISLLRTHIPQLKMSSEKKHSLQLLGEYEELRGNYKSAQKAYSQAADLTDSDYSMLYRSALMLHYMGEYSRSELKLLSIIRNTEDQDIKEKSYLLLARSFMARGDTDGYAEVKKQISNSNNPLTRFYMGEQLQDFPRAPEYLLNKGQIQFLPDPLISLGIIRNTEDKIATIPEEKPSLVEKNGEQVFLIQTGSFIDRENAEYLSKDLKALGFTTYVQEQQINGKTYNKVFVRAGSVEEGRTLILKLKDKGFEGYPIY